MVVGEEVWGGYWVGVLWGGGGQGAMSVNSWWIGHVLQNQHHHSITHIP